MENKRNTKENVRKNLGIKLQTDLPPRGRQNWVVKGNQMQKGGCVQEQVGGKGTVHHFVVEGMLFSKDSRSHLVFF